MAELKSSHAQLPSPGKAPLSASNNIVHRCGNVSVRTDGCTGSSCANGVEQCISSESCVPLPVASDNNNDTPQNKGTGSDEVTATGNGMQGYICTSCSTSAQHPPIVITCTDCGGTDSIEMRTDTHKCNHHTDRESKICIECTANCDMLEIRELAHVRLKEELLKAQQALKVKGEECNKLKNFQEQMNIELEELTAKLFEEANKMVQDANIKRMTSEKYLKEANSKIEVLQAEVVALKALVITSTPSMPNYHLHPQLDIPKDTKTHNNNNTETVNQQQNNTQIKQNNNSGDPSTFVKTHRRSTSHHNFTQAVKTVDIHLNHSYTTFNDQPQEREMDAAYFSELTAWRSSRPCFLDVQHPFLKRIIRDDVKTCLEFTNTELSERVYNGIISNTLCIEPVVEKQPLHMECSLTGTTTVCKHRLRMSDSETWKRVCRNARNRLAAVCDFVTYIRYITQGLVKSEDRDIYWEVMRLRKQMTLARLGLMS